MNSTKDIFPMYEISSNLVEICLISRLIRVRFDKTKNNIVCKPNKRRTDLEKEKIQNMSKMSN